MGILTLRRTAIIKLVGLETLRLLPSAILASRLVGIIGWLARFRISGRTIGIVTLIVRCTTSWLVVGLRIPRRICIGSLISTSIAIAIGLVVVASIMLVALAADRAAGALARTRFAEPRLELLVLIIETVDLGGQFFRSS